MSRFFALIPVVAVIAVLAAPLRANEAAIRSVIEDQIEAFLSNDLSEAFTYASPMIQQLFGTPGRFGQMVREGYPMVWRPDEVTFLPMSDANGRSVQPVMLRDGAGALHILDYDMIQTDTGWKIDGVRLRRPPAGAV
ncbi:MAG TPA: DUF4864 domain-containing protein [Roseovarius sp.]|nr:DUF4864 domain-containing protein [Roseovarius sp.]